LAATGFVALIVGATVLIVRLESAQERLVVRAEIDQNGQPVSATNAVPANPAGNGTAVCPPLSIAMAGGLTGQDTENSINIKNGVQLAIQKHNSANAGCQVQVKEFDTGGDPVRVSYFAPQIVADAYTVGLIGPSFSGVADAAGDLFEASGLPAATASASRSSLAEQGRQTFYRAVASDEVQGRAVANYVKHTLRYRKVCVVSDGSPYGDSAASAANETLGELSPAGCRFSGALDDKQFDQAVERVKAAAPDAVLRTGSSAGAPELVGRLRNAGVTSAFISAQGAVTQFVARAGNSGKGALLSCPCGQDTEWFSKEYRRTFGTDPGAYSAEGYDLATIMLNGIDAGRLVRPQMLDWMRHYDGQGVARRYQWTANGELTNPTVWIYEVK